MLTHPKKDPPVMENPTESQCEGLAALCVWEVESGRRPGEGSDLYFQAFPPFIHPGGTHSRHAWPRLLRSHDVDNWTSQKKYLYW